MVRLKKKHEKELGYERANKFIFNDRIIMINIKVINDKSSPSDVFFGKGVLKICSRFTGEHPCRSVISIKLLCSFIEITLWHGCSPVNLLHFFRTPFPKNTYGGLLL